MEVIKIQSEAFGTIRMDVARIDSARNDLAKGYLDRDISAIAKAARKIRDYVSEGLDDYKPYDETVDDYRGNDPVILADQYITHVFNHNYLDDDPDGEYIETGLKPYMRIGNWNRQPVQLSLNF